MKVTTKSQQNAVWRMDKKVAEYIDSFLKEPGNENYYATGDVRYNTVPLASVETGSHSNYTIDTAAIIELQDKNTGELKYIIATDQYANGDVGVLRKAAEIQNGELSVDVDFSQIVNQAIIEQKLAKEPFNENRIKNRINDLIAVREDGTIVILTQTQINMMEQEIAKERERIYDVISEEDRQADQRQEKEDDKPREEGQAQEPRAEDGKTEDGFLEPKSQIKTIIKVEGSAKTEFLKVIDKEAPGELLFVVTRNGTYGVTEQNGRYVKFTGLEYSGFINDILAQVKNPHSTSNETIKDGLEAGKTGEYPNRYDMAIVDKKTTTDSFDATTIEYVPGQRQQELDDVERRTGKKTKILDDNLPGNNEKAYRYPDKMVLGDRVEVIIEQRDIRARQLQNNVDLVVDSGLTLEKDTEIKMLEKIDEALVREDIDNLQATSMREKIQAAANRRNEMEISIEDKIETILSKGEEIGQEVAAELNEQLDEAVASGYMEKDKADGLRAQVQEMTKDEEYVKDHYSQLYRL